MNKDYKQSLIDLVAEYEAMTERQTVTFLDVKAYERLIDFYEEEEQLDRALEVTDFAISHHPFSVDFHIKKAELLLADERAEKALVVLDRAAAFAPLEPEIALLRAEAFINLDQLDTAGDILDDLKSGAEGELLSDILFVESMIYQHQELYEMTYFSLRESLRVFPTNRDAIERIWNSIDMCKRYEEAIDLFEMVLEADAYSTLAWYYLGHAHSYKGNYAQAIECYEYAYLTDETFEAGCRECAELCLQLKLYRKALRFYEELMENFEPDSEVLQQIGLCHQYLEQYKIARTFYTQALNYDPLDDEVLFHIGECFAKEENWKRAIRYFQKAIDIEDSREEYYGSLAAAYGQLKDLENASDNFEKAIEVAPEESRYWIEYTCFLLFMQEGEEALALIDEAEENAGGMELLYCRVACLFFTGRRQEGIYRLSEALEEDFETHRLLFNYLPSLETDPDIISVISAYMM